MRFAAGLCWAGTCWLAEWILWVQTSASGTRAGWPARATAVEAKLQRAQGLVSSWLAWKWLSSEKGEPANSRASNIARAIRPLPFIRASSSRQIKIIAGFASGKALTGCASPYRGCTPGLPTPGCLSPVESTDFGQRDGSEALCGRASA